MKPLDVECPVCHEPAGFVCYWASKGAYSGRPHAARVRAAEKAEKEKTK